MDQGAVEEEEQEEEEEEDEDGSGMIIRLLPSRFALLKKSGY